MALLWLVTEIYRGWRDGELAQLCRRYGYTYAGLVPIDFLEPLVEPPWTAFIEGLDHNMAMQTMVLERPGGDIFAANFSACIIKTTMMSDRKTPGFPYTIIGLRLTHNLHTSHIAAYIDGLHLDNGLRVVMRGNCVYAMFKSGTAMRINMPKLQRIQLMQAMRCVLEGRYADATALFEAQLCRSQEMTYLLTPMGISAVVLYLGFMVKTQSLVMLGIALVVLVLGLWSTWSFAKDVSGINEYLEQRGD